MSQKEIVNLTTSPPKPICPIEFEPKRPPRPVCPIEFEAKGSPSQIGVETKESPNSIDFIDKSNEFTQDVKEEQVEEKRTVQPAITINPIAFIAKRKDRFGRLTEFEVEDPALAGMTIPDGFTEEEFLRICLKGPTTDRLEKAQTTEAKKEKIQIVKAKNADETALVSTNYDLQPYMKKIFVDREGKIDETRNEIFSYIVIKNGLRETRNQFSIKFVDLDKLTKVIGRKFPTAILYDKKCAMDVENYFREKSSNVTTLTCYTDAGWQKINGRFIYVHMSQKIQGAEIDTSLNLPMNSNYNRADIKSIFYKALGIYDDFGITSILNVYAFLGVSYKCFEEADFAPHFLLFITGKTGSMKTTLSKILFTQLADERYREFPRRIDADTVVSFERGIVSSGRDTVTLIDDYSPAKSKQGAIDMAKKLESIIRMVGDGSTKSRSNVSLDDRRGEGVKGTVVLTGELRGQGLSSNLRCLYCEIERGKVNLETVTWFQQNKNAFTSLIQHYVFFVSEYWEELVYRIKNQVEPLRRNAEKVLEERRLVDTLVILWIMTDIIGIFLERYCGEVHEQVMTQVNYLQADMISVVKSSELNTKGDDPARIYMEALVYMLDSNKLRVAHHKISSQELIAWDGFYEGGFLYLLPDNAHQKVVSWLRNGGVYLAIDINQLGVTLCNEGYAVPTSNGTNKKIYYARLCLGDGKKVKFLKIPMDKIRQIQKTEEEE